MGFLHIRWTPKAITNQADKPSEIATSDEDNHYWQIQYSSSIGSAWHTVHTCDDMIAHIGRWKDLDYGAKLTIVRNYGWDEGERKELARLKKKYEADDQLTDLQPLDSEAKLRPSKAHPKTPTNTHTSKGGLG